MTVVPWWQVAPLVPRGAGWAGRGCTGRKVTGTAAPQLSSQRCQWLISAYPDGLSLGSSPEGRGAGGQLVAGAGSRDIVLRLPLGLPAQARHTPALDSLPEYVSDTNVAAAAHLWSFEPAVWTYLELYLLLTMAARPSALFHLEQSQSISSTSILHLHRGTKWSFNSWTYVLAIEAHPGTYLPQSHHWT